MKKYISLIFFIFLIANCAIASNNELLSIQSDNTFWRINTTTNEAANIIAVEKDTINKFTSTVVKVNLAPALTNVWGNTCHEFVKKQAGNKMLLSFSSLSEPKKNNYQFNSAGVYLKTESRNYHLKLIDNYTGQYLDYGINNVNGNGHYKNEHYYSPSFYYYQLPIICDQLNGVSIEISGIYKNGKELPPIKFRINLLNQAGIKS